MSVESLVARRQELIGDKRELEDTLSIVNAKMKNAQSAISKKAFENHRLALVARKNSIDTEIDFINRSIGHDNKERHQKFIERDNRISEFISKLSELSTELKKDATSDKSTPAMKHIYSDISKRLDKILLIDTGDIE